MNATTHRRLGGLAASIALVTTISLVGATRGSAAVASPSVGRHTVDRTAMLEVLPEIARWATAHGLTGLSPAYLTPITVTGAVRQP